VILAAKSRLLLEDPSLDDEMLDRRQEFHEKQRAL
jgi:hypothetical protein